MHVCLVIGFPGAGLGELHMVGVWTLFSSAAHGIRLYGRTRMYTSDHYRYPYLYRYRYRDHDSYGRHSGMVVPSGHLGRTPFALDRANGANGANGAIYCSETRRG